MSELWDKWEIDTTPRPAECPEPQSLNAFGYGRDPARETRGRIWWTNGSVITVDFLDWSKINEEVKPWEN